MNVKHCCSRTTDRLCFFTPDAHPDTTLSFTSLPQWLTDQTRAQSTHKYTQIYTSLIHLIIKIDRLKAKCYCCVSLGKYVAYKLLAGIKQSFCWHGSTAVILYCKCSRKQKKRLMWSWICRLLEPPLEAKSGRVDLKYNPGITVVAVMASPQCHYS